LKIALYFLVKGVDAMFETQFAAAERPDRARVITKAVLAAAQRLGINSRALGMVLGLSEPTISRMKSGEYTLATGSKAYELAVLLVRMFRSLDAITGGDEKVTRAWMGNSNTALEGTPAEKIRTITGLFDVVAYLDARRALV
jgi:hypothetical protein